MSGSVTSQNSLHRALLLCAAFAGTAFYFHHLGLEFDTKAMIQQNHALVSCLSQLNSPGPWKGCEAAGPFALFQRIPSLVLAATGMKDGLILRLLAVLSFFSFMGLTRTGYRSLQARSEFSATAFLLVMLSGPFLWYARSSFGESLAAFATLGFVVLCRRNAAPWKIIITLVAAGISKDTAVPFLVLLGITASEFNLRRLPPLLVGSGIALTLNFGFNFFKYLSWQNVSYLDPLFLVKDFKASSNFFLGLWFSPHGGWVFFWPLFAVLLAFSLRTAWIKRDLGLRNLAPAWVSLTVLLGMSLGLSRWYAPFGWDAWGPRLLLPWIPSIAFLLLDRFGPELRSALMPRLQAGQAFRRLAFFSVILSFPQFYVLFDDSLKEQIFSRDAFCPTVPVIQENAAYYFKCMDHEIWPPHSVLWSAYNPLRAPGSFALACVCAYFWVLLLKRLKVNSTLETGPV